MANVYDGLSRAPLRVGLALVGAADAIGLAVQVHRTGESELSHGFAPRFLFAMHDHPLSLIALVVLAVAGLLSFAARRRPITSGLVAVGAIAVLSESHAALVGGPARSFYTVGAVLFGWVFGLAYARGIAANGFRREAANEESLAETGAVGVFAATYFGAGVSKLLLGGVDWADPNHLRAIVVSQHPVADNSVLGTYADVVTNHGAVSAAFALATLVVQLGAVMLLVSPFMRKLWCAAILGFHLNTLLLAHIVYLEAVVIALLFGYPWPAIVARLRGRTASAPVEPPSTPASQRGTRVTLATAICFFGVLAGVGSLPAVRRYTGEHHRARTRPQDRQGRAPDTALPPAADVSALLGGLRVGDPVADFRVAAIEGPSGAHKRQIEIALRNQDSGVDTGLIITVTALGVQPYRAPRSSARYDIFYREHDLRVAAPPPPRREAALDAVLARIKAAETTVATPNGM